MCRFTISLTLTLTGRCIATSQAKDSEHSRPASHDIYNKDNFHPHNTTSIRTRHIHTTSIHTTQLPSTQHNFHPHKTHPHNFHPHNATRHTHTTSIHTTDRGGSIDRVSTVGLKIQMNSMTQGSNPIRSTRKICEFFRVKFFVLTHCRCAQPPCMYASIRRITYAS